MIYVDRGGTPPESLWHPSAIRRAYDEAREYFSRAEQSWRQERFAFRFQLWSAAKPLLLRTFNNKCAYCESMLVDSTAAAIDHFRPKAGAVGISRDYAPTHYWWLAYEWRNLYVACMPCNRYKGAKFPVAGVRAKEYHWPPQERRLLIDPCEDDPAQHLLFDISGEVRPISELGEVTIDVLALNRPGLVEARRKQAENVIAFLEVAPRRAEGLASSESPYAAVARSILTKLQTRATVANVLPAEPKRKRSVRPGPQKSAQLEVAFLRRISLRNFRGIASLDLEIPEATSESGTPWLMLLGENGRGKSSVLQAAALAMMGHRRRTALLAHWRRLGLGRDARWFLRRGSASGSVTVETGAGRVIRLTLSPHERAFRATPPEPNIVVLGYGPTRILPRGVPVARPSPLDDLVGVANLFDPSRPMVDAEQWLAGLDQARFDYAARALKDVLELEPGSHFFQVSGSRRERGGTATTVRVRLHGHDLSLDELSDGYQSVIGLATDIIRSLSQDGLATAGAVEAVEGVVLLDELGAYMHPRWRMRIVKRMRAAFPRVQFIASTHDPLCLRGLATSEVAVLRRTVRGRIHDVQDLPPLEGLRVDQLLTSEYFGLSSTLDPEIEDKYQQLYHLRAKVRPTEADRARADGLAAELDPLDVPGATRRERLLLEAIDHYIGREQKGLKTPARPASGVDDELAAAIRDVLNARSGRGSGR